MDGGRIKYRKHNLCFKNITLTSGMPKLLFWWRISVLPGCIPSSPAPYDSNSTFVVLFYEYSSMDVRQRRQLSWHGCRKRYIKYSFVICKDSYTKTKRDPIKMLKIITGGYLKLEQIEKTMHNNDSTLIKLSDLHISINTSSNITIC